MIRGDWLKVRVDDVCNVYAGTGFPRKYQGQKDGRYPFYKVGDISRNVQNGFHRLKMCDNYVEEGIVTKIRGKVLPVDCVVFAKIGEALKLNRRAITTIPCLVDNNAIGVGPKKPHVLNPLYLYYFFLTVKLEDYSRATTVPSVRKTDIEAITIPLPPIPEQRKIVAKIEQLFSELDNGIAVLKAAKRKLKIYRETVLKEAFAGSLTNVWRVNEESNLGNSLPEANENIDNVHLVPGWRLAKLGEITQINPSFENWSDFAADGEVQFVPMKLVDEEVNNIYLTETRKLSEVRKGSYTYFEDGDVLFAKVTPCMENGKIAIARNLESGIGYGSSEFHVLRCYPEIDNRYLFFFLVQQRFRADAQRAMTGAVGLRRVPKKFLEDYNIPLPPISEQIQIVEEIENRLRACDKVVVDIDHSLSKADALRQSILKKAFEGKLLTEQELEACRQEPDWEPADKLLEQIKKQGNE